MIVRPAAEQDAPGFIALARQVPCPELRRVAGEFQVGGLEWHGTLWKVAQSVSVPLAAP